jgi:hypothetical protein
VVPTEGRPGRGQCRIGPLSVGLVLALVCLGPGLGVHPASGAVAVQRSVTVPHIRLAAATGGHTHSGGHKQSTLAVVVSVAGIIVLFALLLGLGSISVRRRSRRPPTLRDEPRGPPRPGRGRLR